MSQTGEVPRARGIANQFDLWLAQLQRLYLHIFVQQRPQGHAHAQFTSLGKGALRLKTGVLAHGGIIGAERKRQQTEV